MDINTLTWLIAVCAAIVVYSAITILFSNTPRERIRSRVDDLAANVSMDNIHAEVMSEKKRERKQKQNNLISKRFADTLEMSGIKFSPQEFLILWLCTTLGPVALGTLFSMHTLAITALTIIGFAIPPFMVSQART